MIVDIVKTVREQITLPEEKVKEIVITKLKRLVAPGEYMRFFNGEGFLTQDDPYHRHGSVSEEVVRRATPLDLAVFRVLEELRK